MGHLEIWKARRNPEGLGLMDAVSVRAWRHRRGLFRWPQGAARWSRGECRMVLAAAGIGLLLVVLATGRLFWR